MQAGNDLSILELKYGGMKEQVKKIEDKKLSLTSEKENLQNAIRVLGIVIAKLGMQMKMSEIKSLNCKQRNLSDRILDLMNTKEYKKVKEIAGAELF